MYPEYSPPQIIISEEQAAEFLDAILEALYSLAIEELEQIYLFHDRAVVISFSFYYKPFIGFTMDYNDPDYRVYINRESYVLDRIAEALDIQGREIPGGRVFIEREYAYIKDMEFGKSIILYLDWQGFDPYEFVIDAINQITNWGLS
jgi:hypothetical protein